ncbi:MAG TPA: hypothetical protein VEW05_02860 [Candidatus Polarisedimenticolia bacterium]|nr:hypothetical protein [Candidatus Polarisedimenticolia bacterium]
MPIPGAKYRFRKISGGKEQRLAFKGGKVVEVANYSKAGKKGVTVLTKNR